MRDFRSQNVFFSKNFFETMIFNISQNANMMIFLGNQFQRKRDNQMIQLGFAKSPAGCMSALPGSSGFGCCS